jgi:hypothetical protein
MDNLRGRLGSTRQTKRGLGCNADSSSFDPANASAMQAHFRPELTGFAPKTFGECGRYFAGRYSKLMSDMDWEFSVAATSWSGDSKAYGQCQPHIIWHPTAIVTMETRISKRRRVFVPSTIFFGGGETRESESLLTFGEISKLRHLASISLYE